MMLAYAYNDFHNTKAAMRFPVDKNGAPQRRLLTREQARRLKRRLCGVTGCTCSDISGQRISERKSGWCVEFTPLHTFKGPVLAATPVNKGER